MDRALLEWIAGMADSIKHGSECAHARSRAEWILKRLSGELAAPAGDAAGELQEELRQLRATVSQCDANKVTIAGINDTLLAECTRLRAALTAQGEQIAALRAALEPFAEAGRAFNPRRSDEEEIVRLWKSGSDWLHIRLREFRAAAAALASAPAAEPAGDAAGEQYLRNMAAMWEQVAKERGEQIAALRAALAPLAAMEEVYALWPASEMPETYLIAMAHHKTKTAHLWRRHAVAALAALASAPAAEPASSVKVLSANVFTPAVNPACLAAGEHTCTTRSPTDQRPALSCAACQRELAAGQSDEAKVCPHCGKPGPQPKGWHVGCAMKSLGEIVEDCGGIDVDAVREASGAEQGATGWAELPDSGTVAD